jgi:hypothetical protein
MMLDVPKEWFAMKESACLAAKMTRTVHQMKDANKYVIHQILLSIQEFIKYLNKLFFSPGHVYADLQIRQRLLPWACLPQWNVSCGLQAKQ